MRRLERGADGAWWVRETPEGETYGTTSEASTRRRVPVEKGADRKTAAFVVVSVGLITKGEL